MERGESVVWRGGLGKRKAREGREPFWQRQDRERKGESKAHGDHARKALPLKVAGEKEKKRVKMLTRD